MQRSSELPIELVYEIFEVAARHAAVHDRNWLCALALASRFVCHLVRPIIYKTVSINSRNIAQVLASVQSNGAHWQSTRNLHIDLDMSLADARALAALFSRVQHVISDIPELEELLTAHRNFRPTCFTCTGEFSPQLWTRHFSCITHLHFAADCLSQWTWARAPLPPPLSGLLSHVVIQIKPKTADSVLLWFLASPAIQRVSVWKPWFDLHDGEEPLIKFARARQERRVRLIETDERRSLVAQRENAAYLTAPDVTDSSMPPLIDPTLPDVLTFDPALWDIGKEIR